MFFDVHLKDVYAESVEFLEPSGRNSKPVFGMQRIEAEMALLHRKKQWNK